MMTLSSVSPTLCMGTGLPRICISLARLTVGWTRVWVRDRSSRARRFWNWTRLSAPRALAPSAPTQSFQRPANPANVTFM